MIRIKDDREAIQLLEKLREEYGVSVDSIINDLGITRNHYNRLRRTGRLHGDKVGFIAKLSALLGDTIEIDGVNDDSTAD